MFKHHHKCVWWCFTTPTYINNMPHSVIPQTSCILYAFMCTCIDKHYYSFVLVTS